MLKLLPTGLDFVLEAPCATWAEHMSLRQRTNVPLIMDELATDEASVMQLISEKAADGIGLKVSKHGGLTRARRLRDMCMTSGLTMSVQETAGSQVAFAALTHLGQSIPHRNLRCVLDTRDMYPPITAHVDIPVVDGRIRAPQTPGLGLTINRGVIGEPVTVYR